MMTTLNDGLTLAPYPEATVCAISKSKLLGHRNDS